MIKLHKPTKGIIGMSRKLFFSSDHNGVALLGELAAYAREKGFEAEEFPVGQLDYIDITLKAIEFIHHNPGASGILICASGLGVCIAANRDPNIRAALCRSPEDARLARRQNNANILCLGSRYTSTFIAKQCLDLFLAEPFKVENHQKSVKKLASFLSIDVRDAIV